MGERYVRWIGIARARQLCQVRELAARVIPARSDRAGERRGAGVARPPLRGVFGEDVIVLARVGGPRLPITSVAGLARQLRRALMSCAEQPVAEVISGHQLDGAAAEAPHLAVVPLPGVVGPCADGALIGIALVLPSAIDDASRAAVMQAIARAEGRERTGSVEALSISLLLGGTGTLVLQRDPRAGECCDALRPATWIGPARRWASATPIALDRNPGELRHPDPERRESALEEAAACVSEAVRRIGLPAPVGIDVLRSPVVPGTAGPQEYPRFPSVKRRPQRVLIHALLRFAEPVCGPILLGAGRFHGLGLFLPTDERDRTSCSEMAVGYRA